jgi:hypothetical protein
MKTIAIESETRRLEEWLPKEDSEETVLLTREGRPRYVLVRWMKVMRKYSQCKRTASSWPTSPNAWNEPTGRQRRH